MTAIDGPAGSAHERAREIHADFQAEVSAPWLMCDRHPADGVAFRFVDEALVEEVVTFGQLRERSERVAHALAEHGVGPGDRVASLLGKGPDLPALILGIWRLGAVYVPLFTAFAATTIVDRVAVSKARVLVTDMDQLAKARDVDCEVMLANIRGSERPAETNFVLSHVLESGPRLTDDSPVRGPATPIVHMFTSGTTGKPKEVVHPLAYAAGWQSYLELGLAAGENFWCGADPGWAYGLYTLIVGPLAAGIPSIFTCGTFKPEVTWRILQRFEVTDFAAAPTALRALRASDTGVTLPKLRRLSTAGEPLTADVGEWTRSRFGVDVHDHFGQTELGMTAGFPHQQGIRIDPVPSAMGTSLPGWSMAVLELDRDTHAAPGEVGRLAARVSESPFLTFTGYGIDRANRAERFTSDGAYYLTGDLASIDDGLIRFSSRDDDVILMAGYRIGPFDVESVLLTHPLVSEVAVVAAPDPVRGEVIHAFVVPVAEVGADEDELIAELKTWVRENYAAHAYPRQITFVPSLPKTPSGKVQRAVLRQEVASAAGTDGSAR